MSVQPNSRRRTAGAGHHAERMRQSRGVETATQTYHRLTSYEPGREWDSRSTTRALLQDLEINDHRTLPWFYKRYAQPLPTVALPRDLPATTAPAVAVLAGSAEVAPARARPAAAGPAAAPVRRRGAHRGAAVRRPAVPRRRLGRRPLPARAVRRRARTVARLPAGVHWYDPLEHALVRSGRRRAGERAARGRHRRAVAHRLALPRARLPPHLLGRRHDAGAAARGRDSAGLRAAALHALPRRDGHRARRRGRRARVAGRGRRARRRRARARGRPGRPSPARSTARRSSFRW